MGMIDAYPYESGKPEYLVDLQDQLETVLAELETVEKL